MRILSLLLSLCLCSTLVYSQSFHRTYALNDDEQIINIAGIQTSDEGFASLDGVLKDTTFKAAYLVKYDKKGTLTNVSDILFDDLDSLEFEIAGGSLLENKLGELVFTLVLFDSLGNGNKYIGAIGVDNQVKWSYLLEVGNMDVQSDITFNNAIEYVDSTYYHFTNVGPDVTPTTYLNNIDYDGNINGVYSLTASFAGNSTSMFPGAINHKLDSSILLTGLLNDYFSYHLTELDKDLNVNFSKAYLDTTNFISQAVGTSVAATPDSGYVVSGIFIVPDFTAPEDSYIGSFISKHDTLADVVWSKRLALAPGQLGNITKSIVLEDGSIMATGTITDDTSTYYYLVKLDSDGSLVWGKKYGGTGNIFINLASLFTTTGGGFGVFTTAFINSSLLGINLIKTDADGSTTCEDELLDIFEDITFQTVDIDMEVNEEDATSYKIVGIDFRNLGTDVFAVPEVTLETMRFCPNEPIVWTFDATIDGATAYKWNTGDTTATLTVFDDEEYDVMVTIDEGVCYTLCDTAQVDRFELPKAQGSYGCLGNDTYELNLNIQADAGVQSIQWSTGDSVARRIVVMGQGLYSVTVTDNCGEVAEVQIDVNPPLPTVNPSYDCREDGIHLLSNFPPAQTQSISWSTGAQDDDKHDILLPSQGQYMVTLTDICNETTVVNYNVDPPTPTINGNYLCTEAGIVLSFALTNNNNVPPLDITWGTGQKDPTITVLEQGIYNVTVTDLCRETAATQINVDPTTPDLSVSFECVDNGYEVFFNINGNTGILSNMWSTGAQDDNKQRILVTQEGSYTVTVTDLCRETVTATNTINLQNPIVNPTIVDCNMTGQVVSANFDVNRIKSITWSTGAQDDDKDVITIATPGTYMVTLTDICNKTTVSTFVVPELPDDVNINVDLSGACGDRPGILTATFNGIADNISWSTGQQGVETEVFEPGTYVVTVTDDCGNTLVEQVTILADQFPFEVEEVNFLRQDNCISNESVLTAQVIGRTRGIEWSTGSNENTITVPVEGQIITLTALDDCGNKSISKLISNPFDSCYAFANIFFPSMTTLEKTENLEFGAYPDKNKESECTDFSIDEYELKVFNRWGQEIFSSTNVEDRWRGDINGESNNPAPPAAYVWYAKWTSSDGCRYDRKGDITLFR